MVALAGRVRRSEVMGQVVRFVLVGGFVTVLGVGTYLAAAYAGVVPLVANLLAYLVAMAVGYVLHSRVSFRGHGSRADPARRTARFVAVSLVSLALNSLWVWGLTGPAGGALWWPVVPMVLVTPVVTFALNRRWVFA